MNVGFTGTQEGMTDSQSRTLTLLMESVFHPGDEFHHGDCIGADAEACDIAETIGYITVAHPPEDTKKRANKPSSLVLVPLPYLDRNKKIVDATQLLLVAPRWGPDQEPPEGSRGEGTLWTLNYARRKGRHYAIVWPNGLSRIRTRG